MSNSIEMYKSWKSHPTKDKLLESDLNSMKKEEEIKSAFKHKMEFGTAGIRGILGAGTNKINIRTIGAAAEAYAQYLVKHVPHAKTQGIVIGHDNRHNWSIFSEEVAKVFNYYGIKAYLFENNALQPTPLISYAIRKLKAAGGVIITASHNPAEYNGFKVYNELGAQLTTQYTKIVSENMKKIDFLKINIGKLKPFYINQKLIDSYVEDLLKLRMRPKDQSCIKIVYSPLHGTGHILGPLLLHKMNYQCYTVNSQMTSDPDFSATKSLNPENYRAYSKGIKLAKKTKSDLVLLTDPDADRIGVVVKYKRRYKYLNGNQVAALYLNYKLTNLEIDGGIPKNSYIVKSNVSSDLVTKIAEKFGVKVYETHVGFKNIAQLIEEKQKENFLFAFEESFGFLINSNLVRDKDAIQGLVAIAEAANYYKSQNSNLFSELLKLYKQHNFYRSVSTSKKLDVAGTERLFARLIAQKKLGNKNVSKIEDYRLGLYGLEPANFVKIYLENYGWFAVRPSGTEPKVKFYFNLHSNNKKEVVIMEQEIKEDIEDFTEDDLDVKISKKTIFKFGFFIAILIAIMVLLLFTVYNVKGDNGSLSIFVKMWDLIHNISSTKKLWILVLILYPFFNLIPSALFIKRAMKSLGSKISLWHTFLASLIAICISAITPFETGGAVASYWYLRKKGYARKDLLSSYLMNSLAYQFVIVIRTFIFLPLGFWIFKDIYLSGSVAANFMLFLTGIGFLFDCISTTMIALLTMNRKIQNWIINTAVTFLEWSPFIAIADPFSISSKYEHELYLLRSGMYKMIKNIPLVMELLFYEFIPIFYSGYLFAALAIGAGGTANYPGGFYLGFLTGSNLIRSANSMMPMPGGSGSTEWMSTQIFEQLFDGNDPYDKAAGFTGLVRAWTYVFPLIVSAFTIFIIFINEKFNYIINTINKNNRLNSGLTITQQNKFKKYAYFILTPTILVLAITFLAFLFIG